MIMSAMSYGMVQAVFLVVDESGDAILSGVSSAGVEKSVSTMGTVWRSESFACTGWESYLMSETKAPASDRHLQLLEASLSFGVRQEL